MAAKGIKSIEASMAWSEGAQVWLVPALTASEWTKKIDWYLNFQITKSSKHEQKELTPEFLKFISQLGLELSWKEETLSPVMMILSLQQLPCDGVVILPEKASTKAVLQQALKTVENMKRPRVRIFPADAGTEWPNKNDIQQMMPDNLTNFIELVEAKA